MKRQKVTNVSVGKKPVLLLDQIRKIVDGHDQLRKGEVSEK
jgi:hypothetical protein